MRLRAEARTRLPDPQSLAAAHSALVSRGSATASAVGHRDEDMVEVLGEGDAVLPDEEVSLACAASLCPYERGMSFNACVSLGWVRPRNDRLSPPTLWP